MAAPSKFLLSILLTIGLCFAVSVYANNEQYSEEFIMAWKSSPTSLDPQYQAISPNKAFAAHVFDPLFYFDWEGEVLSDIITKTTNPDDLTWVFHLKSDIYFHDNTELTSKDIIYTLDRLSQHPSPNKQILSFLGEFQYRRINKYQFEIKTAHPRPGLNKNLANIYILKATDTGFYTTEDFNNGKALIGTGPYQFIRRHPATGLHLKAFDNYHGNQPYLKKINIRYLADAKERIAAFQSGQIDLIDKLTPAESKTLRTSNKENKFSQMHLLGDRLMYLYLDQFRDSSPQIFSNDGRKLERNPLKNLNVRKALSHAIDRQFLTQQLLNGAGVATGQFLSEGRLGHSTSIPVDEYDPVLAKHLLKEAGFGSGFKINIHGPNDRYIKDKRVIESIARMWSAVGVTTKAISLPKADYFPNASKLKYSVGMAGNTTYGVLENMLKNLLLSYDEKLRTGIFNRGRYSNKVFDESLRKGSRSFNQSIRYRSFRNASEVALADQALIPLYIENYSWGIRGDMVYRPRSKTIVEAYAVFPRGSGSVKK